MDPLESKHASNVDLTCKSSAITHADFTNSLGILAGDGTLGFSDPTAWGFVGHLWDRCRPRGFGALGLDRFGCDLGSVMARIRWGFGLGVGRWVLEQHDPRLVHLRLLLLPGLPLFLNL